MYCYGGNKSLLIFFLKLRPFGFLIIEAAINYYLRSLSYHTQYIESRLSLALSNALIYTCSTFTEPNMYIKMSLIIIYVHYIFSQISC